MTTPVLVKCLAGGVCTAAGIGLPVVMHTKEGIGNWFQTSSERETTNRLVVENCKQRGEGAAASSIEFGNKDSKEICWNLDPTKNQVEQASYEQEINSLFKSGWNYGGSAWSSFSNSSWKSNCINRGLYKWVLIQPGSGENLGLCDTVENQDNSKTMFLHKQTENRKVKQIKLCFQDCWDGNDQSSSDIKTYQNLKSGNWSEVKFQRTK